MHDVNVVIEVRASPSVTYRRKAKNRLVDAFHGKCGLCGYCTCKSAFDFHHVDPSDKEINLAMLIQYKWSRLVKEAKKCVMVCRNCHAEVHAGLREIGSNVQRFDLNFEEWPKKPKKEKHDKRRKWCEDSELIKLISDRKSYSDLGRLFGISATSVRKRCLKIGIEAVTKLAPRLGIEPSVVPFREELSSIGTRQARADRKKRSDLIQSGY